MNQVVHFVKKRALPAETDFRVSTQKSKYLSDLESEGVEIV